MMKLSALTSVSALLLCCSQATTAFQPSAHTSKLQQQTNVKSLLLQQDLSQSSRKRNDLKLSSSKNKNDSGKDKILSIDELKSELTTYLAKRKEMDADNVAQAQVGKVVGGTKGNAILEYVSGSPNKAIIIEEAPNVLDYDELDKYGYGGLVKSIMQNGGRNAMYDLMELDRPLPPKRLQPKSVPKLVIDKTGETDLARYTGLKMGQVMDDDTMGEALAAAQRKSKEGKKMRANIQEEDYIQPFADKRNVSPQMTPEWTAERLDEYGKSMGRAQAWERRSKLGEFVTDPFENLDLPLSFRFYSIFSAYLVAFAFGRATPNLLTLLDLSPGANEIMQAPAFAVVLASVGSAVVGAAVLAPSKNRGSFVWGIKGLLAGPAALLQLRELESLVTNEEEEERQRQ